MKKIIFIFIIIITIFLIYILTSKKKISYLNISDTENPYVSYLINYIDKNNKLACFNNSYSKPDYRITDLINDIEENKKIEFKGKNETLKNALIKYDIITLNIGNTDLYNKIDNYDVNEMYDYVDEILVDYERLFKIIRKITKEKIVIFSYTSPNNKMNKLLNYYNNKLNELCKNNKIYFVNVDKNTEKNLEKIIDDML